MTNDLAKVMIAKDMTLILSDRIGSLAATMRVLAEAGVNILGHGGFPAWAGEGVLHLIVDDPARAIAALHSGGTEVREERDILVVSVEARPGSLAEVLERIAELQGNVDLTYTLADGRVAIGVTDLPRITGALAHEDDGRGNAAVLDLSQD